MDNDNNVIKYGMDMAVPMALYTTLMSLLWVFNDKFSLAGLLFIAMLMGGPVLLYLIQRRFYIAHRDEARMWDVWRMGVVAIFFGSVFTLLVTYLVLEYVRPGFIYEMTLITLKSYEQIPEMANNEMVTTMRSLYDDGVLPTAWQISLTMFLMTNVSSMFMGLFTAMVAQRR